MTPSHLTDICEAYLPFFKTRQLQLVLASVQAAAERKDELLSESSAAELEMKESFLCANYEDLKNTYLFKPVPNLALTSNLLCVLHSFQSEESLQSRPLPPSSPSSSSSTSS